MKPSSIPAPRAHQQTLVLHQKANVGGWWRRGSCKAEQRFLGFIPRTQFRVFKGGEIQKLEDLECRDCSLHLGIPVRPLGLGQLELVWPPPQHQLPAMNGHGLEARRRAGDDGGVVGAHEGGLPHPGLGGGGGLKTSSPRKTLDQFALSSRDFREILARMEIAWECEGEMRTRHANARANLTIFCESKRG